MTDKASEKQTRFIEDGVNIGDTKLYHFGNINKEIFNFKFSPLRIKSFNRFDMFVSSSLSTLKEDM